MSQSAKHFAARLNKCLDETDAPTAIRERAVILSKMINISKHQALSLLEGQQLPTHELLEILAREFDVEQSWLNGSN